MQSNGNGTDHGWGNHHFVIGGAVNGNRMVGDIPDYNVSSSRYTQTASRMIPTIAVEQYAATLGRWFGLGDAELTIRFPVSWAILTARILIYSKHRLVRLLQ